ncbi:hypothetical protein FA13DRAFT_1731879 [Coprinellus micaceus]|uniref:Mid2 domain-containing protein n=1 Tax=Coprinellus micaceus TaxID=71717 RepID=A0A4Y7TDC2_COPMI|nr:hypothetical protein FA13DRAFT_1731879 [Coprinellus micaceus]
MLFPVHLLVLVVSILSCSSSVAAQAQRNVTVDDEDPSIVYQPAEEWFVSANSSLDFGHAHMLTQNPNATATFNFTGVAIYFLSPLWPYTVNTAISLDGMPPTLVDLIDRTRPDTGGFGPETVQWDVVWSATNLTNTNHTLLVSVGSGQRFGIVDGLIYTIIDPEVTTTASEPPPSTTTSESDASSSSPVPVPTPSSTDASSQSGSSSRSMKIALGSVLGVLGLLIVLLCIWFCIHKRRRNRPRSEAWTVAPSTLTGKSFREPPHSPLSGSSHISSNEKASPLRTTTTTGGPSPISLGPPATYPSPSTRLDGDQHPYSSAFYAAGEGKREIQAYQNPRFGYVGIPAPQDVISPDLSLKQYAEGVGAWYSGAQAGGYGPYARGQQSQNQSPHSGQGGHGDRENDFYSSQPDWRPPSSFTSSSARYTPGIPLSPITERSFSSLRDSPQPPGTPGSGASGLGSVATTGSIGYFVGTRVPIRQGSGERAPARQGSNESGISLNRAMMESREGESGMRPPREQQHPLARARPSIGSGTVSRLEMRAQRLPTRSS